MSQSKPLTRTALAESLPTWGVLVLESHHAPDFQMEWRTHRFLKLLYCLQGGGEIAIEPANAAVQHWNWQARDVVIVPPGHRNRIIDAPETATALFILCIAPALLRFDSGFVGGLRAGAVRRSSHFANQVERALRKILYVQARPNALTPISMVAEALQLLAGIAAQPLREPPGSPTEATDASLFHAEMQAYLDHLQTHFMNASTIDQAAAQSGIPRRQFTALFRELAGETWLDHVHRLRISHARHLLQTTILPITTIGFECGFADLSTFYRVFRKQTGQAPGVWRTGHQRSAAGDDPNGLKATDGRNSH